MKIYLSGGLGGLKAFIHFFSFDNQYRILDGYFFEWYIVKRMIL